MSALYRSDTSTNLPYHDAQVQVQWMYLLPIFSSKDIVDQLPEEGILFSEVDGTFRRAMLNVAKEPRVRELAGSVGPFIDIILNSVLKYPQRIYFSLGFTKL